MIYKNLLPCLIKYREQKNIFYDHQDQVEKQKQQSLVEIHMVQKRSVRIAAWV